MTRATSNHDVRMHVTIFLPEAEHVTVVDDIAPPGWIYIFLNGDKRIQDTTARWLETALVEHLPMGVRAQVFLRTPEDEGYRDNPVKISRDPKWK